MLIAQISDMHIKATASWPMAWLIRRACFERA